MQFMGETTTMHIRLDPELKREATEAFRRLGLSPSEAVRMFLTRVVAQQAIPFDINVPNAKTRSAIRELRKARGPEHPNSAGKQARALGASGRSSKGRQARFGSVAALMADLNSDD